MMLEVPVPAMQIINIYIMHRPGIRREVRGTHIYIVLSMVIKLVSLAPSALYIAT
jgi:hypothetical protein